MTTTLHASGAIAAASPVVVRLGEELPVFCERCGYSLHGLPQTRCEHCTILQFHCPECGHHQPINTLRPAAQTLIGRIRGGWLALVVFFKINLFGWLLFAWVGMGAAWSYRYDWQASQNLSAGQRFSPVLVAPEVNLEAVMAFLMFGLPFGMVLRMTLLKWKKSWAVGLALAALALMSMALGVVVRRWGERVETLPEPWNIDFLLLVALGCAAIILGAMLVWPVWTLLVHAFLPKRTAKALLGWQLSLSNQVSALARP
jgi:hypothetical protein